jgi:ATP adenylyltransferase
MDNLWTPWRYQYIKSVDDQPGCIFCQALEADDDEATLILHRAQRNFVVLNRYPYTNGHLMVAPIAHGGELEKVPADTLAEMMQLAQQAQKAMKEIYEPDGFNLGMNLGRAAGAGVEGHVHLHVLPRWVGDTPFITTTGETRTHPEELTTTFKNLQPFFE